MTPQPQQPRFLDDPKEKCGLQEICGKGYPGKNSKGDIVCYTPSCKFDTRSRPAPETVIGHRMKNQGVIIFASQTALTEHDAAVAAQARVDVLNKGISVIKNRIECIMISYEDEKNKEITVRPYAMADGMNECIIVLKSLREAQR